jgi:hypothetical protein
MAGWFDGLFRGASEVENRFARADGPRPPPDASKHPEYVSGFRQGVLDAWAVAAFRRAESVRRQRCEGSLSGFHHPDPRT